MQIETKKLQELRKLLFDLHTKWSNDKFRDGHCKSSEGYIGITFHYPNWFEAKDYLNDEPTISVEVYSYLFGTSRSHYFDSIEEAIKEVKKWEYNP